LLIKLTYCILFLKENKQIYLILCLFFSLAGGGEINRPSRPGIQRPFPRPQSVEPFFETHRIPLPDVCYLLSVIFFYIS